MLVTGGASWARRFAHGSPSALTSAYLAMLQISSETGGHSSLPTISNDGDLREGWNEDADLYSDNAADSMEKSDVEELRRRRSASAGASSAPMSVYSQVGLLCCRSVTG